MIWLLAAVAAATTTATTTPFTRPLTWLPNVSSLSCWLMQLLLSIPILRRRFEAKQISATLVGLPTNNYYRRPRNHKYKWLLKQLRNISVMNAGMQQCQRRGRRRRRLRSLVHDLLICSFRFTRLAKVSSLVAKTIERIVLFLQIPLLFCNHSSYNVQSVMPHVLTLFPPIPFENKEGFFLM